MTQKKKIAVWLWIGCGMIAIMVNIGAITRLTGSGLSIVHWDVVTGVIPPLTHHQWERAFRAYQQSPQYKLVNEGMTLSGFKAIFWWEFIHRLLGRTIGMYFIFQLIFFYWKGWLNKTLIRKYVAIILWVGVVGAWGWYMVKSGLINQPWVSPYRLTVHLILALSLFSYIFWNALTLWRTDDPSVENTIPVFLKRIMSALLILFGVQIIYGGLMSGLHGALFFPTFPLMHGRLIPGDLFIISPFWRNFFENGNLVNAIHRTLPWFIAILIFVFAIKGLKSFSSKSIRTATGLLVAAVVLQITLGALTVINSTVHIPVFFAAAHQFGALIMLTLLLFIGWHVLKPDRRLTE
ncbi:MAG TPA: COX15/CtaA family protein [Balneolales bacterium]|nr:COX15/CtaA family protein [Balneolales bacterium]